MIDSPILALSPGLCKQEPLRKTRIARPIGRIFTPKSGERQEMSGRFDHSHHALLERLASALGLTVTISLDPAEATRPQDDE